MTILTFYYQHIIVFNKYMEKIEKSLKAVHENDLDNLLEKISKKTDLEEGRLKCKFCSTPINKDNLYSILPEAGAFNFICENSECVNALLVYLDERKSKQVQQ